MMKCNGHKMFHGTVRVNPVNKAPFDVTGTWLFIPPWMFNNADGCWYCKEDNDGPCVSYTPDVLDNFRDDCSDVV